MASPRLRLLRRCRRARRRGLCPRSTPLGIPLHPLSTTPPPRWRTAPPSASAPRHHLQEPLSLQPPADGVYLLTMPGDKPFHTKDLSAQIGSSACPSPAGENGGAAHHAPRLRLGDGAAVRHGASVQLVMDRDVYDAEYFCCHPWRQPRLTEDQNERPAHKISSPCRSRAHRRGPAEGISKQKRLPPADVFSVM